MKTLKFAFFALSGLAFSLFFSSCETNPDITPEEDILPEDIRVDIPLSLSFSDNTGGKLGNGRSKTDTLKGNDIYLHLGTFIAVGERASEFVEDVVRGLRRHRINRRLSMTFVGDDGRPKNLTVESNVEFEGTVWAHQLTITDADAQGEPDGGKALQLFWNKRPPIKGIAIVKPYNCDQIKNANMPDAMFRIDYARERSLRYDVHMEVRISGLPLESPLHNPYSMSTLHMFAGKKGNVVDIYGNSNHPNAILFSGTAGFNWAFVASGNENDDAAVAEVGLPASTLDSNDRDVLLKEYSIKNVFTNEIKSVWPDIDQQLLDIYLKNTAAPGYFDKNGFISGGDSPGEAWDILADRIEDLTPYNPKEVSELTLTFE